MSTNNAFIGQVYFLDGAAYPTWLTYDSSNKQWLGAIRNITPSAFEDIYSMQGNFEFKDAESGSFIDRYANKVVSKQKTTGKLTICIDAQVYGALLDKQGSPTNIVVVSRDIEQGDYIHQVIPHFTAITKAGDMQIAELSFEFDQAANIPNNMKRRRIFEIVASGTE